MVFFSNELLKPLLGRTRSRAGVEQPFNCLIVQNCQAMQSMGRSMNWTLEDNMVDALFCDTLGNVAEAVKPDPRSSWEGHSEGVGAGVGEELWCNVN